MFRNYIMYNKQTLCTFTSPHVPHVGEHVRIYGTTYLITNVVYMLDECVNGTTEVVTTVKPI